jgi:hypothetical protein
LNVTEGGVPTTCLLENGNNLDEATRAVESTKQHSIDDISKALVARQCHENHPADVADGLSTPSAGGSQVVAEVVRKVQEEAEEARKEVEKLRAELYALKSSLGIPPSGKAELHAPSMPPPEILSSSSISQGGNNRESEEAPGLFSLFHGLDVALKPTKSIINDNGIATDPVNETSAEEDVGDKLMMVCTTSFQSLSAVLCSRGSEAHGAVEKGEELTSPAPI